MKVKPEQSIAKLTELAEQAKLDGNTKKYKLLKICIDRIKKAPKKKP